jgi:hypothetical protein
VGFGYDFEIAEPDIEEGMRDDSQIASKIT